MFQTRLIRDHGGLCATAATATVLCNGDQFFLFCKFRATRTHQINPNHKKKKWTVLVAVGQPELAYLFWAGRILDYQKPDADADRASARPEQVGSLKNHPVLEAKTNRPVFEVNKPSNFKHTKSSGSGAHDNYDVT